MACQVTTASLLCNLLWCVLVWGVQAGVQDADLEILSIGISPNPNEGTAFRFDSSKDIQVVWVEPAPGKTSESRSYVMNITVTRRTRANATLSLDIHNGDQYSLHGWTSPGTSVLVPYNYTVPPAQQKPLVVASVTITLSHLQKRSQHVINFKLNELKPQFCPSIDMLCGCQNNCSKHGRCVEDRKLGGFSVHCDCDPGYEGSIGCETKASQQEGWGKTLLLVAAIVACVLVLERCYSSIKKVYLRRTGRLGFQQLAVLEDVDDDSDDREMFDVSRDRYHDDAEHGRFTDL